VNKLSNFTRAALCAGSAMQALMVVGAGVASVAVSTPVMAQDYNQVAATGRVIGTNGKPVAGATVTVMSDDQGFSRSATTDSNGSFRITGLPQGNYSFTIDAQGFESFSDAGVSLTQSSAANQFTLLASGGASGDIVVTAGRVAVADFDRNTTGTVINVADVALRVPVVRDLTSIALLSPGTVSGGASATFGALPSINGASVSENVYYVNGLNITQFRNGLGAVTVPFDFYQSVEIKNGGISAEFGRTTGGVINATTKSGGNTFHGSIGFNWQPNGLRAKAPNVYNRDNDSTFQSRKEMIAQLSGPIIKDHLFFAAVYQTRDSQDGGGFVGTSALKTLPAGRANIAANYVPTSGANSCVTNPSVCTTIGNLSDAFLALNGTQYRTDRTRSPFYGIKVDAVIVDGQRIEGTYFNTSNVITRDLFGTSLFTLASGNRYNPNTNTPGAYASTTVFQDGGENYVLRYTGSFTDWLTVSAAYGSNGNRDTTDSSTPNLPSVLDQRNGANTQIGNLSANKDRQFDKRKFYRADVDLNFNILGSHHVRFGYDREELDLNSIVSANGGFQYTLATAGGTGVDAVTGLPSGTNYAIARTFVSGGKFKTRDEAFYIQDSWKLLDDRLQLNLGVRNDKFVNRNADGVAFYKSGNLWAPRLGFSFDPTGERNTKVYGSFSRYFLPIAVNTNVRLAGSELDYDAYYRLTGLNSDNTPILGAPVTTGGGFEACPAGGPTGTACVVRNDGKVPGTGSTVSANLKAQSTDEIVLGGEHRISSHLKVGAFFTYTKLNDSLEDAALDQAIIPYCVAQGKAGADCSAIWNGVHQYALVNPGKDVVVQLSDPLPGETALRTVTLPAAALGYPQAKRDYKAVTVTFDREFDGVWSLSASYTYSKLRGNIEGGIRTDNAQTDAGLTTAFDLPALVNGAYGYLPNDRRHNFKIYGSYKVTDWLTLGANAQVTSPRQFGCLGRAPVSADGTALAPGGLAGRFYGAGAYYCNVGADGKVVTNPVGFDVANPRFGVAGTPTLQQTPRASQFKSNWLSFVNLDATFKIPSSSFDGSLRVSVFNVFNQQNATEYNEVGTTSGGAPNATYSLPNVYQAPRAVRFQLRFGF
jgi:Carboxypeptidase regulatory-like domain/TonB-dependent Receptor Plug Domain